MRRKRRITRFKSFKYSLKQGLGQSLEKWLVVVLSFFFPKEDGWRVNHVDWNNYTSSMGKGVDVKLFFRNKLIAVFECKNWRILKSSYGSAYSNQIVSRFKNAGTWLKIVVISFLCTLSKPFQRLVKSHNIEIIQTNKLIGKKDFKSKRFYKFGAKLKHLIENRLDQHAKKVFSGQIQFNKLDKFNSLNKGVVADTVLPAIADSNDQTTTKPITTKTDTVIEKTQPINALKLIKRLIKQAKLKRLGIDKSEAKYFGWL